MKTNCPLPATFDWRNNNSVNYVTPVRDQEICGSCWAFSSVAAMESRVLIDNPGEAGLNVNLSEQMIISALTSGLSIRKVISVALTAATEDSLTMRQITSRIMGSLSKPASLIPDMTLLKINKTVAYTNRL